MDGKKIGIIAVVIVAVIAIAAAAFLMNGSDDDKEPAGDVYYVFLDGMGEINGWHIGTAANPVDGVKNALSNDNIECIVTDKGWLTSISGIIAEGSTGYAVFEYASTSVASPWSGYYFAGPGLADLNGNIVYISFGSYTMDENWNVTYAVNPSANADAVKDGPFADKDYKPLAYGEKYSFYLDIEGVKGWYNGNGSNPVDALKDAMKTANIDCVVTDKGWITSIDGNIAEGSTGYALFDYVNATAANAWNGYFFAGAALPDMVGTIAYISFGSYTMDENWNVTYAVNPFANAELMTTGPFATA